MTLEIEEKIMKEIGLGSHYNLLNGSGSCGYIARDAVNNLARALEDNGLTLSQEWAVHCQRAVNVDAFRGNKFSLTNTWVACSYAIQDAVYRKNNGKGFKPVEDWYFFSQKEREKWEMYNQSVLMDRE